MTVSTFLQTDFSGQSGSTYFPTLDGDIRVMSRLAAAFAPHETIPASMTVAIDAGSLLSANTVVEVAAQTTATIVAPTTNPRIDRIVIDRLTGAVSTVTGTEATTPVAPALPAGKLPVASVRLNPGVTAITNAMVTDERVAIVSAAGPGSLIGVQRFTTSGTYTPTPGTSSVIVEVQGGGGSGGGSAAPAASEAAAAGGGGAGAFARSRFTSGFAGVAVTIGSGAAPTAAGANVGNVGSASSFGSLVSAPGGTGGPAGFAVTPPSATFRSGSSAASTGSNLLNRSGMTGEFGIVLRSNIAVGGSGGPSALSAGPVGSANFSGGTPINNYGAGGGGGSSYGGFPAQAGGGGGPGVVFVYEYA